MDSKCKFTGLNNRITIEYFNGGIEEADRTKILLTVGGVTPEVKGKDGDYSLGKSSKATLNYESAIGRPREEISLAERFKGQDRCSLVSKQAVNVNVGAGHNVNKPHQTSKHTADLIKTSEPLGAL
ncbi:hypothetical protein CBL_00014 [Carabus blaptoides fortunei]